MRFITEFELDHPYTPTRKRDYKHDMQVDMGALISESFGWKEKSGVSKTRHTLEIEAFPMDKWVEFKEKLLNELYKDERFDGYKIRCLINELESFGKPAGAAKESLNDH